MINFECPYFKKEVILTDERYDHIKSNHPDILPEYELELKETIYNPDSVRKSSRFQNARLFTKFFHNLKGGKYAVVVVVNDTQPEERYWIITAYITRKLSGGIIEWEKK